MQVAYTIHATTDASGDYTEEVTGFDSWYINMIRFISPDNNALPSTAEITISDPDSNLEIWNKSSYVEGAFLPRVNIHDTEGMHADNWEMLQVLNKVKVVIASGGASKSAKIQIFFTEYKV